MNRSAFPSWLAQAANVLPFPPAKRLVTADNDDDPNGGGASGIRPLNSMRFARTHAHGAVAG